MTLGVNFSRDVISRFNPKKELSFLFPSQNGNVRFYWTFLSYSPHFCHLSDRKKLPTCKKFKIYNICLSEFQSLLKYLASFNLAVTYSMHSEINLESFHYILIQINFAVTSQSS